MISNSLDIDFIHGDIHGRSCQNVGYFTDALWDLWDEMGPLDLHGDIYTFGVSESLRPHDSERVDVFRYVCIIGANK